MLFGIRMNKKEWDLRFFKGVWMMKECIRPRKGAGPRCYKEGGESCGSFKEIRMTGGGGSCVFFWGG